MEEEEEEDMVARVKVATVAAAMEAEPVKDRLVTRAEDMVTCLATAPKDKNATTVRTSLLRFEIDTNSSRW